MNRNVQVVNAIPKILVIFLLSISLHLSLPRSSKRHHFQVCLMKSLWASQRTHNTKMAHSHIRDQRSHKGKQFHTLEVYSHSFSFFFMPFLLFLFIPAYSCSFLSFLFIPVYSYSFLCIPLQYLFIPFIPFHYKSLLKTTLNKSKKHNTKMAHSHIRDQKSHKK